MIKAFGNKLGCSLNDKEREREHDVQANQVIMPPATFMIHWDQQRL